VPAFERCRLRSRHAQTVTNSRFDHVRRRLPLLLAVRRCPRLSSAVLSLRPGRPTVRPASGWRDAGVVSSVVADQLTLSEPVQLAPPVLQVRTNGPLSAGADCLPQLARAPGQRADEKRLLIVLWLRQRRMRPVAQPHLSALRDEVQVGPILEHRYLVVRQSAVHLGLRPG